jgi:hypothetical protein
MGRPQDDQQARARVAHTGRSAGPSSGVRVTSFQRSAKCIEFGAAGKTGGVPSSSRRRGAESNLRTGDHPVRRLATELTLGGCGIGHSPVKARRLGTCYVVCTMLRRLLIVGPFAALAMACASPTLPLPPPEEPTVSAGPDADHVILAVACGGAETGALIVIVNTNPSVPGDEAVGGAVVSDCGGWDATVLAHNGDYLDITQEIGTERSQPLVFQVSLP